MCAFSAAQPYAQREGLSARDFTGRRELSADFFLQIPHLALNFLKKAEAKMKNASFASDTSTFSTSKLIKNSPKKRNYLLAQEAGRVISSRRRSAPNESFLTIPEDKDSLRSVFKNFNKFH